MKCDVCGTETNKTCKLYWGFFSSKYEPKKWVSACEECQIKFLQASNLYSINRTPLIELERKIKKKVRKR